MSSCRRLADLGFLFKSKCLLEWGTWGIAAANAFFPRHTHSIGNVCDSPDLRTRIRQENQMSKKPQKSGLTTKLLINKMLKMINSINQFCAAYVIIIIIIVLTNAIRAESFI